MAAEYCLLLKPDASGCDLFGRRSQFPAMREASEYTRPEVIIQSCEAAFERVRDLVAELSAVALHESLLLSNHAFYEPPLFKEPIRFE
jgi:hypothetical protein